MAKGTHEAAAGNQATRWDRHWKRCFERGRGGCDPSDTDRPDDIAPHVALGLDACLGQKEPEKVWENLHWYLKWCEDRRVFSMIYVQSCFSWSFCMPMSGVKM